MSRRTSASPRPDRPSAWSSEEWIRGCYQTLFGPGTPTAYGPAIWKAVGRVHFASTETSFRWYGNMDGAVRSGERAAAEAPAGL
jgi:monoamine oxidase